MDKKRPIDNKDEKPHKKNLSQERVLKASSSGFMALDPYSRHKMLINTYKSVYGGSSEQFRRNKNNDRTDLDELIDHHRFVWDEDDEDDNVESRELTYGQRVAKKYYDRLFKEYAICDLSRIEQKKLAMRWRIEREVISGKGQFICANQKCEENQNLTSWEVNFAYMEKGQKKNTLVKVRLCSDCSIKLNSMYEKKVQSKINEKSEDKPLNASEIINDLLR